MRSHFRSRTAKKVQNQPMAGHWHRLGSPIVCQATDAAGQVDVMGLRVAITSIFVEMLPRRTSFSEQEHATFHLILALHASTKEFLHHVPSPILHLLLKGHLVCTCGTAASIH